eukprot:scaffold131_cov381-Pinguiococcus_pyrenoidosus.AAC.6
MSASHEALDESLKVHHGCDARDGRSCLDAGWHMLTRVAAEIHAGSPLRVRVGPGALGEAPR